MGRLKLVRAKGQVRLPNRVELLIIRRLVAMFPENYSASLQGCNCIDPSHFGATQPLQGNAERTVCHIDYPNSLGPRFCLRNRDHSATANPEQFKLPLRQ